MKGAAGWVRDEIRALKAYHVVPAAGLVKLDAMENPYRLPAELAEGLGRHLAQVPVNRYPDPSAPLLKAALRRVMAIPDQLGLVLGNGSDEILQMIAVTLARPGASMLALEPSFAMYRMSAIAAGMDYVGVPLASDFSIDLPATLEVIAQRRPALTWIAYPNNPTGNLFDRESILAIVAASPGLVVVDEAYYPFAGGSTLIGEVGRHAAHDLVRPALRAREHAQDALVGRRHHGQAVRPAALEAGLHRVVPLAHLDLAGGEARVAVADDEPLVHAGLA